MAVSFVANSDEVEFWCLEPFDSGLLVTYILVCKCAGLPLRILPEISKIPVTVGIGLMARTCIRNGAHPPSCGCCWIAGWNVSPLVTKLIC